MRNALRATFAACVLAIIAFGFYLTGSPAENRLFREDEVRVKDLGTLRNAIRDYHRDEKKLPDGLEPVLAKCRSRAYYACRRLQNIELDNFELLLVDEKSYELCTTFARPAPLRRGRETIVTNPVYHQAGRHCYSYQVSKAQRSHSIN